MKLQRDAEIDKLADRIASAADARERNAARCIGANIRAARYRLGYTQCELARIIGAEQNSISCMERGVYLPSIGMLLRIADVADVPLSCLMEIGGECYFV